MPAEPSFAVLFAPDFALQALRRADAALSRQPVAIAEGQGRNARLVQVSPEAHGVGPGLAVTLAMARCPNLVIALRNPEAEAEAARGLLAAAFSLSPRVEATAEGCCTVDLRGAEPAGTARRLPEIVAELGATGLSVQLGVAPTPLLASYAARRAEPVLVVPNANAFLAALPIAFAEPTPAQASSLSGWGIATCGELTALSKTEVARRLGTEGARLWERAAGEVTRVLHLVEPSTTFAAEWSYETPIETMEPLLFRLQRYSERLTLELRGAGCVAETLQLVLRLEDDTEHNRTFRLAEPSAHAEGWMRILLSHLETVRTEARISSARLVALPTRPLQKQEGLFDTGLRDPEAFWENLARISGILGEGRVGTPVVLDSWRPDAVALVKPAEIVPPPADEPVHPPRGLTLRRFRPPWPARVTVVDRCPAVIEAAQLRADVRSAIGPFLADGDWWQPNQAWARETWQVEINSGIIYQLVRTDDVWQVEGVLD